MPFQPIDELTIDMDGPVAIVTMNRPDKLNAFSDAMSIAMREVWEHLALERSVRAIVLTGAGRAFCAGGDIPGFIRAYESPIHRREAMRGAQRLLNAMLECPKHDRGRQRTGHRPRLQRGYLLRHRLRKRGHLHG